jgi:hypothetical protein
VSPAGFAAGEHNRPAAHRTSLRVSWPNATGLSQGDCALVRDVRRVPPCEPLGSFPTAGPAGSHLTGSRRARLALSTISPRLANSSSVAGTVL